MQRQAHEVGLTGLATRRLSQNRINADQIDRDRRDHVLQVRFV